MSRARTLGAAVLVAVAVALAGAPARADRTGPASSTDPKADTSAETKTHFQRGVVLYTEEDYRAALVEFKRAYELSSNRAILYNIGQTQFQLRDYAGALQSFEDYLGAGGPQLPATRRQQVEKDIEDLRGRVATVTIETNVEGAEVTIDDASLGAAPLAGPVRVSAGVRKLVAKKPGFAPTSRSVELAGGDTATVRLELVAVSTERPARSTPIAPSPRPGSSGASPLMLAGFGIAAVGVATGTVFGVLALGTKADLDARCLNRVCPAGERSLGDSLSLQATASTIAFGVGLAGLGLGTYFFVTGRSTAASSTSASSASRVVAPWFAGTSGGVAGTF